MGHYYQYLHRKPKKGGQVAIFSSKMHLKCSERREQIYTLVTGIQQKMITNSKQFEHVAPNKENPYEIMR